MFTKHTTDLVVMFFVSTTCFCYGNFVTFVANYRFQGEWSKYLFSDMAIRLAAFLGVIFLMILLCGPKLLRPDQLSSHFISFCFKNIY